MSQTIIITAAGRAALVNAANTGTNPVTITQLGITETAFTPTTALTALPDELKRLSTLSGTAVADDVIHLTVRDDGTDAYAMRGYGFYLSDGTLFAVHGQAAPILNKTAASMMLLSLDIAFADADAELIEFGDANFILPIATTTVYGQVKLSTLAAAQAGTDGSSVLTPSTARQSVLGWLLGVDGSGSGLDADLLDGKQASDFVLASIYTGAQILSRLISVDGAGSGLDADTVDGMEGASFLQASLYTGAQILSRLISVDGAGSGLDADLLDGQHASYFTDIAARLGYTPLNAASYTASDMLTKLLSVDGSGSGVDADLLDGQQGSYFTNIPARLGYTPLNAASYTAADVFAKVLGLDGSGSGLDADLLDGLHASSFIKTSDFNHLNSASGYVIFPSGLAMQWRRGAAQSNQNSQSITWPLAFSTIFDAQVTTSIPTNTINHDAFYQIIGVPTLTNVTVVRQATTSDVQGAGTPVIFGYGIIS